MKKIFSELSRIQQELKAPKTLFNKFGNYYYRNAEGILEAVKPMLNGLVLIINDEPVVIGDRFYIKATVTLTDGEESISAVAFAREDETKKGMDGCQITGACSSYARKYALNALLMIDDSKDSDDDSLSPKNPANSVKAKPEPLPEIRQEATATVSTAAAVPAPKKQTEAQKLIANAKRSIEQEFPGFDFKAERQKLIAENLIDGKPSDQMTVDDAAMMIDLMYQRVRA